jgi:hypothetical protein
MLEEFRPLLEKLAARRRALIQATPAPGCPGCLENRLHTADEDRRHHPLKGHGTNNGREWSHPALAPVKSQEKGKP